MQNSILGKNKQTTTTKSARKPHSSVNLPLYSFEKVTLIEEKQRELSLFQQLFQCLHTFWFSIYS